MPLRHSSTSQFSLSRFHHCIPSTTHRMPQKMLTGVSPWSGVASARSLPVLFVAVVGAVQVDPRLNPG